MATSQRKTLYPEMIVFRTNPENRLQLYRLAARAHKPVSETLRELISEAWAVKGPATKSVPAVGAQTNELAAK
ncbi:MAG: hypothetical protein ACOYBO_07700 [Azonexus sp.]